MERREMNKIFTFNNCPPSERFHKFSTVSEDHYSLSYLNNIANEWNCSVEDIVIKKRFNKKDEGHSCPGECKCIIGDDKNYYHLSYSYLNPNYEEELKKYKLEKALWNANSPIEETLILINEKYEAKFGKPLPIKKDDEVK